MHVVIFAGGTLRTGRAVQQAIDTADLVIAADSGAATALQYGCQPAIVVGDFDSLPSSVQQQLQEQGSQIRRAAVEKDETDTELAIQTALEQGAERITLLGALGGGRFDHTVANILLLGGFPTVSLYIIDGPSTAWLAQGPGITSIEGEIDDLVSLLPLTGDAAGIRTTHLYYALRGETLSFGKPRGVSNKLTHRQAEVSVERGMLLVIHTNVKELGEA